jgi:prepilin-type processing-associated H-X9-DG protein
MKKSDCVTIFACIVFLFFVLGAIGHAGREQARILTCAASLKQIAKLITLYQSDNDGYVPFMRNPWAASRSAQSSLLSLPFRHYSGAAPLPDSLPDPSLPWDGSMVREYLQYFIPKFFVCPFVRSNSQAGRWVASGQVLIGGKISKTNYKNVGIGDSYATWLWEQPRSSFVKGAYFIPNHPYGPDHGKSKYDNVVWHTAGDFGVTGCRADNMTPNPDGDGTVGMCKHGFMEKVHRARFSNMPRMSVRTALYCAHGEIDMLQADGVGMYGSHARSGKGGTNVLFGDGHVEWVQGSQITTF